MTALLNESKFDCSFLAAPVNIGLLTVSIGAVGAPTVVTPCANVTVARSAGGTYDFALPTLPAGCVGYVLPFSLTSSTVIGFQGGSSGLQVKTLVETAGTIAAGDPGNGDVLLFLVIVFGKGL